MNVLGLFSKYWQPGCVKTRLAKDIGADNAASIYKLLVHHGMQQFREKGDDRYVVVSPDDKCGEFLGHQKDWQAVGQGDGDLGARLERFFSRTNSSDATVVIGGDCPTLAGDAIDEAFDILKTSTVVIGPSKDGGYYLIGISGRAPQVWQNLFKEMAWGTGTVLDETLARLTLLSIEPVMMAENEDIDELSDLEEYVKTSSPESELVRQIMALGCFPRDGS